MSGPSGAQHAFKSPAKRRRFASAAVPIMLVPFTSQGQGYGSWSGTGCHFGQQGCSSRCIHYVPAQSGIADGPPIILVPLISQR